MSKERIALRAFTDTCPDCAEAIVVLRQNRETKGYFVACPVCEWRGDPAPRERKPRRPKDWILIEEMRFRERHELDEDLARAEFQADHRSSDLWGTWDDAEELHSDLDLGSLS
jgi:hypothetical protein